MEEVPIAIAKEASKRLSKPEVDVGLDTEMEAVLAKLPANINSPEEFTKYMKAMGKLKVKKLNILDIYHSKEICYKEK